jgi:parallel beta-helix repeat protein
MKQSLLVLGVSLLLSGATSSGATNVLVVDNDRAECPAAEFTAIQAAVTAAAPGDKILVCAGTYHERVLITKDELTLEAKGKPGEVIVDADLIGNGITISGASGVTIEGFTVREGHDNDIMVLNANGNTLRNNVLTAAVHDGIELFNSDDNLVEHNVSIDNLAANACGINLAAGSDRNTVRHNLVVNNEWGIQIAGSADNVIFHNEARGNRGNGIRNVANASGTVIEDNRAFGNGFAPNPATTGTTNSGIRIGSGAGVMVIRNHAFDNTVVDLRSDVAAATFDNNHCNTSSPPGLCEHDEGKGH